MNYPNLKIKGLFNKYSNKNKSVRKKKSKKIMVNMMMHAQSAMTESSSTTMAALLAMDSLRDI